MGLSVQLLKLYRLSSISLFDHAVETIGCAVGHECIGHFGVVEFFEKAIDLIHEIDGAAALLGRRFN